MLAPRGIGTSYKIRLPKVSVLYLSRQPYNPEKSKRVRDCMVTTFRASNVYDAAIYK